MAGGTAVLAQRVLEAVFGDQAIRRLAQTAKDDLDGRVQALLSAELLRYHQVLDGLQVDAEQAERLRAAAAAVQRGPGRRPARQRTRRWSRGRDEPALPAAEERRAIEAPTRDPDPGAGGSRRRTTSSTPSWSTPRGEEYR